jgi:hypothetical protein
MYYYYGEGPRQTDEEQDKTIVAIVVPVVIVVILVLRLLCSCLQKDSEEQDAGGPGSTAGQLRPSRQRTTEAGGRVVDRAPSSTVTPGFRRQTECEPCTCQDQLFTYTAVT